jgi:hypothetical protein
MKYILIAIAVFLVIWVLASIKAAKDPEVRAASKLGMTTKRYRLYKELFDKHQAAMSKYGIHSQEAYDIFVKEINPHIPNPNEWRRFCDYQVILDRDKMQKEIDELYDDDLYDEN